MRRPISNRSTGTKYLKRLGVTKRSKAVDPRKRRYSRFEILESRQMLAAAIWHNAVHPVDVSGDPDSSVSPVDALVIINELNRARYIEPSTGKLPKQLDTPNETTPYYDVNCDGAVSPVDALIVINYLNRVGPGEGPDPGSGGVYQSLVCSPQLLEHNAFSSEITQFLRVPSESSAVRILFDAPQFDTSSQQTIRDAFEIEIRDVAGNLVSLPHSAGLNAVFNWSEQTAPVAGAAAAIDVQPSGTDSSVTVNLSGIPTGTELYVTARLVNNDLDDTTSVIIRGMEWVEASGPAPRGMSGQSARFAEVAPFDFDKMSDISGSIVPSYGRTSLSADDTHLTTSLQITNVGQQTVNGRIIVALDRFTELDAQVMRPDGFLQDGRPFFDFSQELVDGVLRPGDSLQSRELRFLNDSGNRFTYRLTAYGYLNAAPTGFVSQPIDSIEAGKTFRYTAQAEDPENRPLTYSLVGGPTGLGIEPTTGLLLWPTSLTDVGNHQIRIRATDPYGLYVEQTFTLQVLESLQNRPPNFVSDPVTDAIASSGFEITTVAVGDSPAGVSVISGFLGPRLASANSGNQTVGVYSGENNDRFDGAATYATGLPVSNGSLFDLGYRVDVGLPTFRSTADRNGVTSMDQGDVNGDGIIDLVSLFYYDAPSLGVRHQMVATAVLGDGDGGFGSPVEIYRNSVGTTSIDARNLLLRDFDGDGALDVLFIERRQDPRVITILGNGDGTFQSPVETRSDGITVSDVEAVDVNEDGVLDLVGRSAVLGFGASYQSIWLEGMGDGSFGQPVVIDSAGGDANCCYQTKERPFGVADLNGDGHVDLAMIIDPNIRIYHSDGAGNFTLVADFNPPNSIENFHWLETRDFNGDGLVDILWNNHWDQRLELLTNDGNGIDFSHQLASGFTDAWLANYAGSSFIEDIDGDGDLDVIFGHSSSDATNPKVAINDGSGFFSLTEYAMSDFSGDIEPFAPSDIARGAMFGDYNLDGVMDYSYFTSGDDFNGVGIRLGTRPGEFGQTRSIPGIRNDALPGDFNGDGILDLIDANSDVIHLGKGDGTFMEPFPAVGVARPTGYSSVADFNRDGIDDFVATRANQNGSRYYIALANGNGTFTVSDEQFVGSSFYGYSSTLIADFNQDGYPDFAAKSGVERHIDVHLNDPDNPGVFSRTFRVTLPSASQGINVSNWQESYAVADFTGDDIPDLAFAERDEDTDNLMKVVVMEGDGLGGFTRYSELAGYDDVNVRATYGANYYSPGDYSAGDLDGDGDVDLISVTNAGTRTFLNDGTGNFVFDLHLENPGTEQRGRDSWLVDIDENGTLDLIQAASNGGGPLVIRRGKGDGSFGPWERFGLMAAVPGNVSRQPFVDLDHDGHLDFVYVTGGIGNYGARSAALYAGRRDDLVDQMTVDLNGDGNEEVIVVQEQMERMQIFVGDNLGGFTRQPDLQTGRAPKAVAAGDLDGDGVSELITANRASRSLSVYSGDLENGYTSTEFPVGAGPIDIVAAHLNGDEHLDLLALDDTENALWLIAGDGSTTLTTPVSIALGDKPSRVVVADATGDDILDAVVTLPETSRLMILPGNGDGSFDSPIYVALEAAPEDVAVTDLNSDGNPDLATTISSLNVLSVIYGRGNHQFAKPQQIQVGEAPLRVVAADADDNGRLDLLVTNSGDATVSVIYNRFDPNEVYRYDADAVDPDDDPLTYSIVDGPGGLIINSETGQLLWAASPDQVGVHEVTLAADDGRGGIATQSFKIQVEPARENSAPIIAALPTDAIGADEPFSFDVQALDNDGHPLRYRLLDGPEGAAIDPTSGRVTWDGRTQAMEYGKAEAGGQINVPSDASLKPDSITVEGWYKLNAAARYAYLIWENGTPYQVRVNEFNTSMYVEVNGTENQIRMTIPFRTELDRWYHVALTYDATTGKATLYMDGVEIGTNSMPPQQLAYVVDGYTRIGHNRGDLTQYDVESLRIWNVARSPEEIQEGLARQYENDPRIVLDYRFENVQALNVKDHSIYGNNGFRTWNGLWPQPTLGLAPTGDHSFTVSVEDGRGGYDESTFTLSVLPALRGTISGHLFADLNGDGVQNDGSEVGIPAEASLEDWHLYADLNGNSYPDAGEPQATTDINGNYTFAALLPGDYPIRVSPVAGYDVPSLATNVAVTPSQESLFDLAIEQLSLSQIRGHLQAEDGDAIAYWKAYADLDGNGQHDPDEPMAISDRKGNYAITGLPAGSYNIRTELPAGWSDTAGANGIAVQLVADEISSGHDFLLAPTNTSVTGGVHFVTQPMAEVQARQTFRYAALALSLSDEAIRYDISLAPAGMVIDSRTGLTAWKPTIDQVGEHLVVLRATSSSGSVSLHEFTVQVTAPNTLPVVIAPEANKGYVGVDYAYEVVAQDAESTQLIFALGNAPGGATIDASTGRLSWTPTAGDVGSHTFTVEVTDEAGETRSTTWNVNVEDSVPTILPVDVSLPRSSVGILEEYFSRISGRDLLGRTVTWQLVSGPTGLTVDPAGAIRWTPAASQLGDQPVELLATTADRETQSVSFDLHVSGRPVNARPEFTSMPTPSVALGQAFTYHATANDSDRDVLAFSLLDGPIGMSIHPSLGMVHWNPQVDQLGEHDVTIQVSDPSGATAEQSFKLNVSRFGGPPRIVSVPPTEAVAGQALLYSVVAVDREGDPLTYVLLTAPVGMSIVETTGEISWTPTPGQIGQQDVVIQVSDGIGGAATQAFAINVSAGAANLPPVINSTSPRFGAVGSAYDYVITASDPENAAITYTLGRGPVGMAVDLATGVVTWTPTADQVGRHVVTFIATDAGGASAIESFEFDVLAENQVPTINSSAPADVAAGALFMYDVLAVDADLDQLQFELTQAPVGAAVDSFGRIRWQTEVALIGSHEFTVVVRDPRGGEDQQSFVLDVIEDTVPPKVSIIENMGDSARNVLPWQGPFRVFVKAIDNVAIASLTLQANGQEIPLDAAGTATFTFEDWTFRTINATATAIDTNGNVTQKTITFDYDFPEGWSGTGTEGIPTAIISSPKEADPVFGMVSITGTAAHEDFFGYKLSYRRVDETRYTEFFESTTPVNNGELGVWDTSLLSNDEYVIRLEVATNGGVVNVAEHNVGLSGNLKLGNFRLSFTDMVIPVAGIPIEITRIYDTLQADREGDFGYGWRLEYRNTDLQVGLPESGLEDIGIYSPLRPGVKVYLNVPGQGRQGFTFNPDIRVLPGFGGENLVLARPRFTPDPGVTSTLATGTSGYLQVNAQGELYAPGNIPYNPASPSFGGAYVLTTREGITYRIDGINGKLQSARNLAGVEVKFEESGITNTSAETSVKIQRSTTGRITAITDPLGNQVQYLYRDATLYQVIDRENHVTEYGYDFITGYLDTIDGPGRDPIRTEYDSNGRLTSSIDQEGGSLAFSFDPENRIETATNQAGFVTVFERDSFGNLVSKTDALGQSTRWQYDGQQRLTVEEDALGNTTRYRYGNALQPVAIIDPLGFTTTYTYNNIEKVTSEVNRLGNKKIFNYDELGNLVQQVNAIGFVENTRFDTNGQIIEYTNSQGGTKKIKRNRAGFAIEITDENGDLTLRDYDDNGALLSETKVIDGTEVSTKHVYDNEGRLIQTTDAIGNSEYFSYDAAGNRVLWIDYRGNATRFAYNGFGLNTEVIYPDATPGNDEDNPRQHFQFDSVGNMLASIDENGNTTLYKHDELGRLVETVYPDDTESIEDNPTSTFSYDALDRVIASRDENGNQTRFRYDALRKIAEIDAIGGEKIFEYDAEGNLVSERDQAGRLMTFEYNEANVQIAQTYADGLQSRSQLSPSSEDSIVIDRKGAITKYGRAGLNRLTTVTNRLGITSTYIYGDFDRLVSTTNGNRETKSFEYDRLGRIVSQRLTLGQSNRTAYDAVGNVISYSDFNGDLTKFSYDARNRLIRIEYADGETMEFDYSPSGQRVASRNSNGETNFEYDKRDRLIKKTSPDGTTIEYEYDSVGNMVSLTGIGGRTEYEYDALNRLASATSPGGNKTSYGYDAVGQQIRKMLPNGRIESREYDLVGNLLLIQVFDGLQVADFISYQYDSNGNRVEVKTPFKKVNFEYDAENQLISETAFDSENIVYRTSYEYDDAGNRIRMHQEGNASTTYHYDANGRLIQSIGAETVDYQYDDNGSRLTKAIDGQLAERFIWNSAGRLVKVDTDGDGSIDISMEYDSEGNLIKRESDGESEYIQVDTSDEVSRVIAIYNDTNTVEISYSYGNERILYANGDGEYYFHADALGSVHSISDASGNQVASYSYDAFGVLTASDGLETRFQYVGEYYDDLIGLTYLRARYVDSNTGSFVSRDPFQGVLEDPLSQNNFTYAHNNPVNLTDPTGNSALYYVVGGLAVAAIGASIGYGVAVFTDPTPYVYTQEDADRRVTYALAGGTLGLIVAIGGIFAIEAGIFSSPIVFSEGLALSAEASAALAQFQAGVASNPVLGWIIGLL